MAKRPTQAERKRRVRAASDSVKQFTDSQTRTGRQAAKERLYVSTGSLELDLRLGGGWVRGRMYELYGPESAGKTTTALASIAQAQQLGGVAAFIDVEGAADWPYASRLGVDLDHLVVMSPHVAEDAMEAVRQWVRQGIDIIVVDSVAALSPRAEQAGEIGDAQVGLQPRLMSKTMRTIATDVQRHGSIVLWINQIREKVGVMFGSPETTPGGRALKHYASGRIEFRGGTPIAGVAKKKPPKKKGSKKRSSKKKRGTKKKAGAPVGRWVKCHIVKSKTSNPFQRVEFPLIFGEGIDSALEAWRVADLIGLFFKSGAWSYWNGTAEPTMSKADYTHRWNGEADFREAMRDDTLRSHVLEAVGACLREGGHRGPGGEGERGSDDPGSTEAVQPADGEAAGEAGEDGGPGD